MSQLSNDHVRLFTLPGVDRENAAVMFSQASNSKTSRIDEIQVGHLLAIGWRAGVKAGRAQAAADIRAWSRGEIQTWPPPTSLTEAVAGAAVIAAGKSTKQKDPEG